ncbi:hypothetical protein ASG89_26140 [Paenibacillus sp. Soil766]|uniref:hypothetical protein n=1 Tax=Paenibacillus sp. Soil766 TaxID=1736404 RepID=UPI00070D1FD9|nr:hypothetical protein [Paenibacillus sp. Soil766]KRF01091.1 hypothetical protein ASG89_26140 [Paenibacillus sp. Soil766]
MSNRKRNLSGSGKEILESLCDALEIERPLALKIALAKGITQGVKNEGLEQFKDNKDKWTIGEGLIKDKDYILFKHLIINEQNQALNDDEVSDFFLLYIEVGLRVIKRNLTDQTSLEDFRIKILQ